jgi:DUF971 family protein
MGYHQQPGELGMSVRPKRITISRSKGTLQVDWNDGESCEYSLGELRAACPCAECQGSHEGTSPPSSTEILEIPVIDTRSTELDRVEQVGNYALQLYWKDGHSYGIYSWEYLRMLSSMKEKES